MNWWYIIGGICILSGLWMLYSYYKDIGQGISEVIIDIFSLIINLLSIIIQVGASFIGGGGSSSGGGSSDSY